MLDSGGAYRRRYRGSLHVAPVVDLLAFDERNPRSLAYSLAAVADHVQNLPGAGSRPYTRIEEKLVLSTLTGLRLADPEAICRLDEDGERSSLDGLFTMVVEDLARLSDALTRAYFAHAVARLNVSGLGGEST